MQYTVSDHAGNQYGPVDLMTLKRWVSEGRVMPDSRITDNLSNLTMLASQMPELGLASGANQYQHSPAPPAYSQYPRGMQENLQSPAKQGSAIWSVVFRIALAIGISSFTRSGGLIVSSFTVYYAIRAMSNKDPNGVLCLVLAITCLIGIGLWTMYKINNGINTY